MRELLKSITFSDAKRVYTKEVLMRIDLKKLVMQFSHEKIQDELNKLNETNHLNIRMNKWDEYLFMLNSLLKSQQFVLFT